MRKPYVRSDWTAYLTDLDTGETREWKIYDFEAAHLEESDFMWSEGNYSCNCNRALFFARAAGEEDPNDRECGDGAYSIIILDGTGDVRYHD